MDKKKKIFTFLKERKIIERLDVFPFILLQSFALIFYTNTDLNAIVRIIIFFVLSLCQLIAFFSKFWSESLMSKICYKRVSTIDQATHVKVDLKSEKYKMNNRTSICDIINHKDQNLITIEFEKIVYFFDIETQKFIKPNINLKNMKIKEFLHAKPYQTNEEIKNLDYKFGKNSMRIPIPQFLTLFKEHVVAPFFVFQLFCILLWVFDDYGWHSFFTLMMLCVFETTVVWQRIMNLATLRKMRVPPHFIHVYRMNKWHKISSAELLPGDIVSVLDGSTYDAVKEEDEEEANNFVMKFLKKMKELKKKAEEQRNQRSLNTVINKHKEKEPSPLTCDLMILSGSAIVNEAMLTGESVPQLKESINKMDEEFESTFDPKLRHKNCILFAGTKVVKITPANEDSEGLPENVKVPPPDKGAIGIVLKTGFSTSQGKLLRTVMYSSERAKGDSKDAFIFIFILLAIALVASYYVLMEGIMREGEITYKLLLRCIIIITSVVPAELPIELTLAINNSLFFLQGKRIVCIEPFRIPFAGKIDFCCFDKTGTLTKDEFIMRGVVKSCKEDPISALACDEDTASILLGCNSLLHMGSKVVGDPIELAIFKAAGGNFHQETIASNRKSKMIPIRRYAFDSSLKRMSVLVRFYSGIYVNSFTHRVLTKGAPEVIRNLLREVPEDYDKCFNTYAKKGYRILALAYNDCEFFNVNTKREEAEKDLIFCGFVIVETPLKNDTNKYIQELIQSEYEISIITGDHHLTTAKVAQDMKIGPKDILFLQIKNQTSADNSEKEVGWADLDGISKAITKNVEDIRTLSKKYTLGMTGKELENLELIENHKLPNKHEIFQFIKLYCRVNPIQKDDIIKNLIKSGHNPSMCGDGSNDVGALKRAVIGIALLNVEETEVQKNQPFSILSFDDDTTIKSGDVTAAAPFTSKSGSIKCIKNIFIQGRCTLVVTFQMFKILASNCLLSAYSLSVLALKGIKFSDFQSTYIGILVAFYFLMLSKAEPLKKLNKNKPPYTIFTLPSIISVTGQAIIHLASLYFIIQITETYDPISINAVKSLDDPFSPTLMNSIIFIYSALNQTINFIVNYQGEPFMKNLTENKWLLRLVGGVLVLSTIVIFDLHPPLNESLEILPLPDDINYKLSFVGIMLADFLICYVLENWKKLLKIYK
jgi:manganese-transporting P-type ATPase